MLDFAEIKPLAQLKNSFLNRNNLDEIMEKFRGTQCLGYEL